MVDLSRRQVLQAGAAGASALMLRGGWPGAAAADQPLAGPGTGDLKLWYDEPAGTTWLRALPVGNGRLGAMVFGNVEAETLQLNEDTVWAGGPYDSANPGGAAALVRSAGWCSRTAGRRRSAWSTSHARTAGGQLAYQPVGNLRLAFPGRERRRSTAASWTSTPPPPLWRSCRRHPLPARGHRQRGRPVIAVRLTADRPGAIRSRRSSTARSARPRPAPTRRRSRSTASRPTWRA